MIAEEIMMYVWFFFVNNCLQENKDRKYKMTSFWRFVIHGSPLSHRVFVPAGPGSYEGRYDGTSCKFSGGMQWMPGQHTIQKPSAFQTQLMFFRKDFPLFFFKYQSFFETSENLSHLKKHIFLFLRRLAMISTFKFILYEKPPTPTFLPSAACWAERQDLLRAAEEAEELARSVRLSVCNRC